MGDMLSQAEIDALLGGGSDSGAQKNSNAAYKSSVVDPLSPEQRDALGEIGNISMGTAATTLFALLGQKVLITTPKVSVMSWAEFAQGYDRPCVGIRVDYKEGLQGSNIMILKEHDVKIISNLMMGGDGLNVSGELTEIDLSAIAEAMNQMAGSSSTSLSSIMNKKIDIMPPHAFIIDFNDDDIFDSIGFGENGLACIGFRMEVGTLIDSAITQVLPIEFASEMIDSIMGESAAYNPPESPSVDPQPSVPLQTDVSQQSQYQQPQSAFPPTDPMFQQPPPQYQQQYQQQFQPPYQQMPPPYPPPPQYYGQPANMKNVDVQSAQFQNFDYTSVIQQKENMGIIMDVPLEVSVELGRTHKLISEILEFAPGTIIELDKLAGEPIDIFVNGKFVAKGEVVVIDENFGIRISDIVNVENRI